MHEKRKLSDNIISDFWIGYAPDSSYSIIQYLREKWFNEQDLAQASLVKKWQSDYFSFFRNRITFPIFDTRNNIVWFSARVINPEDQPKYLNSSEQAIFEKSKILYGLNFAKNSVQMLDMIVLVEWQMDVIGLARLWTPIWVATCGTAVTEQHFKLLKRFTENVYILFDNDDAGKNATVRALKIAYRENIFPKMIILPDGYKDTDDIANDPNWKEIFDECIKNAKDAFLQVYEMLRQKYDLTSPIDKQKIFNEMFGLIACVDSYTIQEHYKQLLSDKVWLPYEVLNAQFQKYLKTDWKFESMKREKVEKKMSWQPDRELICVSLFWDDLFSKYITDAKLYTPMMSFAKDIASHMTWEKLNKIFFDRESLDSEEKLQLDEWQLWWEKELEGVSGDDKRMTLIKNLVLEYLQTKIKLLLKSSAVSMEEKQKLLEDMKKI